MNNSDRLSCIRQIALAASLCSAALFTAAAADAGVLWVDNEHESVAVPLESPAMGVTRAKMYLEKGEVERAARALRKVVAKYPTATEAHQLLAGIYREQGKTELASLHDRMAARG
jgi:Tfp pilus assembly protein PilF